MVDRHDRLVIRGNPGSGKTTLIRYLAVSCARALRNDRSDGDSRRLVKERLLWQCRPFPILVTLRRHGDVASWGPDRSLLDAIKEELPPDLRKRCPADYFERRFRAGRCLLLLDAFDELGSRAARDEMGRRISGFLAVNDRPANRVVITTRIVGYEGQLDCNRFEVRTVQDLGPGEVRALVKQRYRSIIMAESSAADSERKAQDVARKLTERRNQLIARIEATPRLAQLATNPLMLTLIVLVHSLKVELPEERLLLYRDCVEILAERWRRMQAQDLGVAASRDNELQLGHKLVLLREVAFAMQLRRQEDSSQALLPRAEACAVVADLLPVILVGDPSRPGESKAQGYLREAEQWLDYIRVESGILVEQGLDEQGEPLVAFPHLTFQEFLAATALHEVETHRWLLWDHLLRPAWREVVLLYVGMAADATPIIRRLLDVSDQPAGLLVAGACLAELLKAVDLDVRRTVMERLFHGFAAATPAQVPEFAGVLGAIGGPEVTTFMRGYINAPEQSRCLAAIRVLGRTRPTDPRLDDLRADLVLIVESPGDLPVRVLAREALAQVGDPRFIGPAPLTVPIPSAPASFRQSWARFTALPASMRADRPWYRLLEFNRKVEFLASHLLAVLLRLPRLTHARAFEIARYPVTNLEYARFVEATGHRTPGGWTEGIFPPAEATHPVVGVLREDAEAYCQWLSATTGASYRLPTEWEWERAATGDSPRVYPWGDAFDTNRCNCSESSMEGTTPVGSYPTGFSPYGAGDMSGNVWEMCDGVCITEGENVNSMLESILRRLTLLTTPLFVLLSFPSVLHFTRSTVLRGGSWSASPREVTCFTRMPYLIIDPPFHGFRCLKEAP